jgi:hypothetical protein
VWWRCHRRLLADHVVLVAGWTVDHLMHDGRHVRHPVTPGARAVGDVVVYGGEEQLALDGGSWTERPPPGGVGWSGRPGRRRPVSLAVVL